MWPPYASSDRSLGIEANRFEQPEPSATNVLNGIGKAIHYHLLAQPAQQSGEGGQRPADVISPDFSPNEILDEDAGGA
jgi:hypothetical protein